MCIRDSPYDNEKIKVDKKYIAKKYNISDNQLEDYLNTPPKTFKNFPNSRIRIEWFYKVYRKMFN